MNKPKNNLCDVGGGAWKSPLTAGGHQDFRCGSHVQNSSHISKNKDKALTERNSPWIRPSQPPSGLTLTGRLGYSD